MNFSSILSSALPSVFSMVSQSVMGAAMASSPAGLAVGLLLGGSSKGQGFSLPGFDSLQPLLMGLLSKLLRFNLPGVKAEFQRAKPRSEKSERAQKDTSQAEIDAILNGNYSLEEKIILIAGVVTDSISDQLDEKLKEQGALAKKAGGGDASAAATGQNVENKIQVLMQRLNRMQTLASNMIQAQHSTKKSQIMNIRV